MTSLTTKANKQIQRDADSRRWPNQATIHLFIEGKTQLPSTISHLLSSVLGLGFIKLRPNYILVELARFGSNWFLVSREFKFKKKAELLFFSEPPRGRTGFSN